MTDPSLNIPNPAWSKKAFSFLVRCRQELWGKHNEEVLAWFFRQGIRNRFAHDMILGWNRFARIRPAEAWGIKGPSDPAGTVVIPPGIIVPGFEGQTLRSLFVYDPTITTGSSCFTVAGGAVEPLVWGENTERITVVFNLVHGLFVHQERPTEVTVIVPHPDQPNVPQTILQRMATASEIMICPDPEIQTGDALTTVWTKAHPDTIVKAYAKASALCEDISDQP
jgi:hypothetical protein